MLLRYQKKLSGPIVDRVDLWIDVPAVLYKKLSDTTETGEKTHAVQQRVREAREVQSKRFGKRSYVNAHMGPKEISQFVPLTENLKGLLNASAEKLGLSARAYHKVIKIARTIADLERSKNVEAPHLLEALQYRPKKE